MTDSASIRLEVALSESCQRHAKCMALSDSNGWLRYEELAARAARIAEQLRRTGLAADEIVHVRVSNQALDIAALFGVWLARGVAVPIHRNATESTGARIQGKTRARFEVDGARIRVLGDDRPASDPLLKDAALVIFTSGSTGEPKGAVLSHRAFHGKILEIDRRLMFRPDDVTLLVLNIAFSFGLWMALITLLKGARIVMLEKFDAATLATTLERERVTRTGMVPTMLRSVLRQTARAGQSRHTDHHATLRQIIVGGEALGADLAVTAQQRFADAELVDVYGSTETSTSDFIAFAADRAHFSSCIGQPTGGVEFRISDSGGAAVAAGEAGELLIRSPYLMNGYLADDALTRAAFVDGWFRTGDLARQLDHRRVSLVGRLKELINRGGNKIAPSEIEIALCRHADVSQVIVTGLPDALVGERIHAGIVSHAGTAPDRDELIHFLSGGLEKFKIPDYFYRIPEIPNNGNGKVDRKRFGAMIQCGEIAPMDTQ